MWWGQIFLEVPSTGNIPGDGARFLILQTLLAAYRLIGALGLLPPLNLTQSFIPPDPPPSMVLEQRKGVCFWYTFFAKSKSVQGQIYSSHASPPAHEKLFMQGCRIVPAFSLRTQSGNMNWRVQDSFSLHSIMFILWGPDNEPATGVDTV